ncbi:hypothetical protein VitviT2T_024789 [Vitis vinifera]|uniref:Uncharacterized protein n=1 Tax=Vitis vinifera TaxID=29760 RepID=A0ABY9DJ84_VITVI|nr:hypothetical protein VitviT2T_024789 [Vitis vinifera]
MEKIENLLLIKSPMGTNSRVDRICKGCIITLADRALKEQILSTQAQHTAILRQIQHHLGITSAPEHAIPSSSEPSQAPSFVDQLMPHQEPPTGEAAEPSFP